jgi:quercetin dioxygenase-like cupin family protein
VSKQMVVLKRDEGEQLDVMGARLKFLCTADKTEKKWSLMEAVLPRHAGPPPHEHPWDEAYYVVEGEVRFSLGDRVELVKAGDFIYAPGGTLHAFQGASETPARLLVFDAPAHAEAFFREVDREVKVLPRDMAKVPEIGDRHQLRFVRQ